MYMRGGPPDPEGIYSINGAGRAVMCPLCETIWDVTTILSTFKPEEQERFWAGKGCPDCWYMWSD